MALRITNAVRLSAILISAVFLLSACIGTGTSSQQQYLKPLPKNQKLLKSGKPVNDYVNSNMPSQVKHSLDILNAEPENGEYPAIVNIDEANASIKTLEERRLIEEELRNLSNNAN